MFGDPRLPERIWDKISPEPNSGCWLWTADSYNGYGKLRFETKNHYAHRFVFDRLVMEAPRGRKNHLDHLCRTTLCVNPLHLEPVSAKENIRRSPMHVGSRTHCPKGHPYDEVNTSGHRGKRSCRTCRRERKREKDERERATKKSSGLYLPPAAERTHCPRGHAYDKQNTVITKGGRGRTCRTCKNTRRRVNG